ncbi:glycosyltransferase family 4 protein [Silvimonas iriomotensis]|uniref:glycosyltransferase family 4 protein n=1 Tax=Silvimonas iriomotensis TaxID=449662 RepID=UPI0016696FB1|nr:glycosyltransferase family 4 protein [Silvimonas iriomotensis]
MSPSRKKKLLIVLNYYYPYVSGVSEYARSVAESLANTYDVTVLTGKHLPDLPDVESRDGYTIVRAKPLFFFDKGYISINFLRLFRKLQKEADIVNLHYPMLESGVLASLTKKPILMTYQCDMALVGGVVSRLAVSLVRWSGRRAIERSARIVTLSSDYAAHSDALQSAMEKVVQVYPANRFENAANTPANTAVLPCEVQEGKRIVGFVGRFVKEKGIDVLLEAISRVNDENVVFWLAGDYEGVAGGSVMDELSARLKSLGNQVVLLGRLTDDQLIEFYRAIDVLVLPSVNRFEAFGMVQMEAMTFGSLVVTTNMSGVREVVNRTGFGGLAAPGDSVSLEKAIRSVLEMRETCSREKVTRAVLETFNLQEFSSAYKKLIDELSSATGVLEYRA